MNLTEAVAKQIAAELDAVDQGRKNHDAGVQQVEADGYRIVDGGSVDRDDEDNLVYEYTDWRTDEVLYREKAHPEPWPAGWYHIDAIRDNYDGFVTAESVAGLPHGLVGQISFWVDENEEDARAWLQSGQGGSITITVPAQLFESIG